MSEKLKLAIRLSADPKPAVKAFAELKKKSRDARQALEQTQEELKVLRGLMKAAGGKDAGLARQFEAAQNKARDLKRAWVEGLSPRMRGNRRRGWRACPISGSIPAHAGKPHLGCDVCPPPRVYPRACGETIASKSARANFPGLSPRMRGNPQPCFASITRHGSIPAHAGKPLNPRTFFYNPGVYPRACGETRQDTVGVGEGVGLSPRMRGNPTSPSASLMTSGSIPAHAGKPKR